MSIATDAELRAFLDVMDPEDNATGGGTASAIAGAMAAGLAGMVARVSLGKEGLQSDHFYEEIDKRARALTGDLLAGAEEDSQAFGHVMRAYRMPKGTDEEKKLRSAAIQAGLAGATVVPLKNGESCAEVGRLLERLAPSHNSNATSDLDVGKGLAAAALAGCIDNVEINLGSIKDDSIRGGFERRLQALRSDSELSQGESDV
jgi:formiminotetrahydrofolate cyclodeaminase